MSFLPGTTLHDLSTLVELGCVQRRFPLTGAPPTARQVRYSLKDPLLRFWFRFVYPNLSLIARLGLRFFTRQRMRVTPDASTHERWHCLDDLYGLD